MQVIEVLGRINDYDPSVTRLQLEENWPKREGEENVTYWAFAEDNVYHSDKGWEDLIAKVKERSEA